MMPTVARKTTSSLPLDPYQEALRRLLAVNGVPVGTTDAVGVLAKVLRSRSQFRVRLLSYFEGLLRREAEPVSSLELLALLTSAARGSVVDLADPALRSPLAELLEFVLEAGRGVPNIATEVRAGTVRRPRVHLRPNSRWSEAAQGDASEDEDDEDLDRFSPETWRGSSPLRRAHVAVALFCILFGLLAALISRGHRTLLRAPNMGQLAGGPAPSEQAAVGPDGALATPDPAVALPEDRVAWVAQERDKDESPGARRLVGRPPREAIRARGMAVASNRGASSSGLRAVAAPRSGVGVGRGGGGDAVVAGRDVSTAPVFGGTSEGSEVASRRSGSQPSSLRPASFRPTGGVSDREAIARALLGGRDGDASRDLLSGAAELRPSVMAGSAGIMAANVLSSPVPAYPTQASAARIQGEVVIQAVVGRDGQVMETRVVSGAPLLRAAALEAVRGWSYRPYLVDGKATEVTTTAILQFRLGR